MKVEFKNKNLIQLYEKGQNKKYPLPDDIIKGFIRVVAILEAASDIYDLWKSPSLNFKSLKECKNRYSARISGKYRVEMEINWKNEAKTIGNITIIDISSHYGD